MKRHSKKVRVRRRNRINLHPSPSRREAIRFYESMRRAKKELAEVETIS